jgi:hypothetical protein
VDEYGVPVLDADGLPVWAVALDDGGQPLLDADNNPIRSMPTPATSHLARMRSTQAVLDAADATASTEEMDFLGKELSTLKQLCGPSGAVISALVGPDTRNLFYLSASHFGLLTPSSSSLGANCLVFPPRRGSGGEAAHQPPEPAV